MLTSKHWRVTASLLLATQGQTGWEHMALAHPLFKIKLGQEISQVLYVWHTVCSLCMCPCSGLHEHQRLFIQSYPEWLNKKARWLPCNNTWYFVVWRIHTHTQSRCVNTGELTCTVSVWLRVVMRRSKWLCVSVWFIGGMQPCGGLTSSSGAATLQSESHSVYMLSGKHTTAHRTSSTWQFSVESINILSICEFCISLLDHGGEGRGGGV